MQIPFQRTMTGLGVRKSWLAKVGEQPPKTWDDLRPHRQEVPGGRSRRQRQEGHLRRRHAGGRRPLDHRRRDQSPRLRQRPSASARERERRHRHRPARGREGDDRIHEAVHRLQAGLARDGEPHLHGHVSADRGRPGRHVPGRQLERRQVGQAASCRRLHRRALSELRRRRRARWSSARCAAWPFRKMPRTRRPRSSSSPSSSRSRRSSSRSTTWAASSAAISTRRA